MSKVRSTRYVDTLYQLNTKKDKTRNELDRLPALQVLHKISELEVQIYNTEAGIRKTITKSDQISGLEPFERPELIFDNYERTRKDRFEIESAIKDISKKIEKIRR